MAFAALFSKGDTVMTTQNRSFEVLQAQYEDISKRLKEAKKNRDARQRIAGNALLGFIEDQPDSGTSKMLIDLLGRLVVKPEDRETLGLEDLLKKLKAAPASSATVPG